MFSYDNPRGRWLEGKQTYAQERLNPSKTGIASKGLVGSVTAYTKGNVMVDTAVLARLQGVNNEARKPGEHQYDDLVQSVESHGWDDHQLNNAILVGVNHLGDAYIIEGNTRTAYAHANGIERVRARIQWYNGAEDADGVFCLKTKSLDFCHPDIAREAEPGDAWF